jgi:hypothetical protein
MFPQARNRCILLAVAAIAASVLCAVRPARAQGGITTPGPVFGGDRVSVLVPFRRAEFLHASTFNGTVPRRPTDPERLVIESIDWGRGTFEGYVYLLLDPYGQSSRPAAGQIRAVANGYEVSFVATKGTEHTDFVGRLDEVVTPDRHFWVLGGQYNYTRPAILCTPGLRCTLGPFGYQMQGVVTR